MQAQIDSWEQSADERAIFLRCYMLMTQNVLAAIGKGEFADPEWVAHLLDRFAGYYFTALESYEQDPAAAPAIWRTAFRATAEPQRIGLQKLLLGVNAHINYDLVLALADLLGDEWIGLSAEQRAERYRDHCHINAVIGRTINAVQDQVLEPDQPALDVVDKILGPLDELLIERLLAAWREAVWQAATQLVVTGEAGQRQDLIRLVENNTLRKAEALRAGRWGAVIDDLWERES